MARLITLAIALLGGAFTVTVPQPAIAQAPAGVRFQVRAQDTLPARPEAAARGGETAEKFEVDGLRVIVRQNPANDVVAANLYLLGGTQQLTRETQGIEAMLLAVSERGTRRYSRQELRQALARTGSTISVASNEDWTRVSLRTIRAELDSSWAILADRIAAPRLDSADLELVRAQMLSAARQRLSSPDAHVARVADSIAFSGHPYALLPEGTAASIAGLRLADLRRYQESQMVKSRMLLVVVGNVTRRDVQAMVARTLGRLPRGEHEWRAPAPLPARSGVELVGRTLPTNYILGYYAGPPASSPDYAALRVAAAVLSGSFFSEIRTRRNLTYAVDAPFIERAVAAGGVYVTTAAPDTTLALMHAELNLLRSELLPTASLQRLVQRFITDYFLRNETNADQADFLARAELYEGDYRAASRFVETLRKVTPRDVQRVARRYMRDFQFVYLGDTSRVDARRMHDF